MKKNDNNISKIHNHGRESLVTLLSKTFINKLVLVIGKLLQKIKKK